MLEDLLSPRLWLWSVVLYAAACLIPMMVQCLSFYSRYAHFLPDYMKPGTLLRQAGFWGTLKGCFRIAVFVVKLACVATVTYTTLWWRKRQKSHQMVARIDLLLTKADYQPAVRYFMRHQSAEAMNRTLSFIQQVQMYYPVMEQLLRNRLPLIAVQKAIKGCKMALLVHYDTVHGRYWFELHRHVDQTGNIVVLPYLFQTIPFCKTNPFATAEALANWLDKTGIPSNQLTIAQTQLEEHLAGQIYKQCHLSSLVFSFQSCSTCIQVCDCLTASTRAARRISTFRVR